MLPQAYGSSEARRQVLVRFLRETVIALITIGLAAATMFIGVPLALLGYFAVFGFFPAPSVGYSVLVGVLAWGAAGFLFWSTALWLAWCDGRRPRFTTRSLFVAVTLASIYFGLVAIAMTGDPR